MLRITSGIAKNKQLVSPDFPEFRGVKEVVKLAVFSIIGDKILDANVLDLFAGSGNMGLEALSRGAKSAFFVDENYDSIGSINKNIESTSFTNASTVIKKSAVKFVEDSTNTFDIIFIDPFYKDHSHKHLFGMIERVLNKDGLIFYLHETGLEVENLLINTNLKINDQKKYSSTTVSIISLK